MAITNRTADFVGTGFLTTIAELIAAGKPPTNYRAMGWAANAQISIL
jgi:hypothetical protein